MGYVCGNGYNRNAEWVHKVTNVGGQGNDDKGLGQAQCYCTAVCMSKNELWMMRLSNAMKMYCSKGISERVSKARCDTAVTLSTHALYIPAAGAMEGSRMLVSPSTSTNLCVR